MNSLSYLRWKRNISGFGTDLQDDVVESDEVLWTGAPLVLVGAGFLQFSLQSVGHALVSLHQCAQLDVGQITGEEEQQGYQVKIRRKNLNLAQSSQVFPG